MPTRLTPIAASMGWTFAGAVAVFEDEQALTIRDDISSVDEQRYLSLGRDVNGH